MRDKNPPGSAKADRQTAAQVKAERLKAALKANMAKRKAQTKARGLTQRAPKTEE